MNWELDHVYVATEDAVGYQRALQEVGLVFEQPRVHLGQGTANTCALFENAYLELLYTDNWDEHSSDLVRPLGLSERLLWRETGACPFGLCFRPSMGAENATLPFATWEYAAPYLPAGVTIRVVTSPGSVREPMVFLLDGVERASRKERPEVRQRLTGVRVRLPVSAPALSAGVQWFCDNGLFAFERGGEHEIELEWDEGRHSQLVRLAPEVPMVLRW